MVSNAHFFSIWHEDSFIIILDKPSGITFQGAGNSFFFQLQRASQQQLHSLHRLDRETSGLVVVAKNAEAAKKWGQDFQGKRVVKIYMAVSDRKPNKKQGRIVGDMVPLRDKQWKLTRGLNNPAESYFSSFKLENGLRLFFFLPLTGKTHQIRVAMRSLGSPILGDELYKGKSSDRLYLHSYALNQFRSPNPVGEHWPNVETVDKYFREFINSNMIQKLKVFNDQLR